MKDQQIQTNKKLPAIIIILFVFACIQFAIAIAVIVYLAVMGYIGFNQTSPISLNDSTVCTDSLTILKYVAFLDENITIGFIASALAALFAFIILIMMIKVLASSKKFAQEMEDDLSKRGLIRKTYQVIMSLFIGLIMVKLLYIVESLFLISITVVFGKYLSFFIQLPKFCQYSYVETQIIVLFALSGAALMIGIVVWIIIMCIIQRVKSELIMQNVQQRKSEQIKKSQQKRNESKESNRNKQQIMNKYQREDTYQDLKNIQKDNDERVQQNLIYQNKRSRQFQDKNNKEQQKNVIQSNYYDQYNKKKTPTRLYTLNNIEQDKQDTNYKPNNSPKIFELSPYRRSTYRSKFRNESGGKQRTPQKQAGIIYSRKIQKQHHEQSQNQEKQRKRSIFRSRQKLYQSPYKQVQIQDSSYYRPQNRYNSPTNSRSRYQPNTDNYKQRQFINSKAHNQLSPKYQGSIYNRNQSYYKQTKKSISNTPSRKKRGILNDYIRGKYIQ